MWLLRCSCMATVCCRIIQFKTVCLMFIQSIVCNMYQEITCSQRWFSQSNCVMPRDDDVAVVCIVYVHIGLLAVFPLNFPSLHFFWDWASSQERPDLFISSLIASCNVFLSHPLGLVPLSSIIARPLIQLVPSYISHVQTSQSTFLNHQTDWFQSQPFSLFLVRKPTHPSDHATFSSV